MEKYGPRIPHATIIHPAAEYYCGGEGARLKLRGDQIHSIAALLRALALEREDRPAHVQRVLTDFFSGD